MGKYNALEARYKVARDDSDKGIVPQWVIDEVEQNEKKRADYDAKYKMFSELEKKMCAELSNKYVKEHYGNRTNFNMRAFDNPSMEDKLHDAIYSNKVLQAYHYAAIYAFARSMDLVTELSAEAVDFKIERELGRCYELEKSRAQSVNVGGKRSYIDSVTGETIPNYTMSDFWR